jgi:DNA-binding LacI/PurR family transcriptional regulator
MSKMNAKPLYLQLSDNLRDRIRQGEWQVGDRLPSFTEIQKEHGAAIATIQRVYDVLEREGLVERRARSGIYVSNPAPVQTGMLAFVVPDEGGEDAYSSSSYSMRLLRSAHQEIAACGYQLTLCTPNQLRSSPFPIDGCIVQGDLKLVKECATFGIPMVSLISEYPGIPTVGTDEFSGFKSVTEHLLQLGHRRIAALIGSSDTFAKSDLITPQRVQGYHAALAQRNIHAPKSWVRRIRKTDKEFSYANWRHWSYQEMRRWLREDWEELGCTAIVTQNDSTAIGVIEALHRHGYRVPQDVSVTGYDDSGEDNHFNLKLTTVHVPLESIAKRGVQLLNQMLAQPVRDTQKVNLPTHIIAGESTLPLEAGSEPE